MQLTRVGRPALLPVQLRGVASTCILDPGLHRASLFAIARELVHPRVAECASCREIVVEPAEQPDVLGRGRAALGARNVVIGQFEYPASRKTCESALCFDERR